MKLFIIRHAQSANNLLGERLGYDAYMEQRNPEPPLTELGLRQAALLAEHCTSNSHPERKQEAERSGYAFTHLYCSPMLRTLQTAWPLSQVTGLKPQVWIDLHEQGGIFQGNPHSERGVVSHPGLSCRELQERFPGYTMPAEVTEQGWWFGGYEAMDGCHARAAKVAQTLRRWAGDMAAERVALICHGTFAEALIRALLALPADHRTFYSHYNTAITRIDFLQDEYLILRYLNRIQHLPPELISR
jgi:broad specificity phosphatase PhoE